MSDDEYFLDEEDDLYIEDPYAEAVCPVANQVPQLLTRIYRTT